MIERLERYLTQTHITLFMVTHDRYFLERICTDIFSLERGKLIQYPGNYSYFLEKKAEREENEQIELHKLKQLLKRPFFFGERRRHANYLLAGSFTHFLIERYSWQIYRRFYRYSDSVFLLSHFKRIFGVSLDQAELQWRRKLLGLEQSAA